MRKHSLHIYLYTEKLHPVVYAHFCLQGSTVVRLKLLQAHSLDVKVLNGLVDSNTAPQFGTLLYHTAKTKVTVESAVQQELWTKEVVSTILLSLLLLS